MTGKNGIAAGVREKSDEVSRRAKGRIAGNDPRFCRPELAMKAGGGGSLRGSAI